MSANYTTEFVSLWHQKLATEREYAHLYAQGREVEADSAFDRLLGICAEIRRVRAQA
jgi:hypothetical protein